VAAEKTSAIILRTIDFSESSCVVTLFTRDFGKISALAKGARRPKGPFEAAIDLLALVRIVFLSKSSDALDLLTEAKLDRRFRAASKDLTRLYAGYYIIELLDDLTDNNDPHPELFDIANQTILNLDSEEPVASNILRFEMAALNLLGHSPSWRQCVGCGSTNVELNNGISFGLLAGGAFCRNCRAGKRQVVRLGSKSVELLEAYMSVETEDWRNVPLESRQHGEIRGVINQYFSHLLGKRPRMHKFLGLMNL
jgi:DNA repair protein RecO (recombination protein O)